MRQRFFKREQQTNYVELDTEKCEACWNCIEVCTHDVLSRINLPWHRHILLLNGSECIGCMKCVKTCRVGALTKLITE